MIIMGYQGIGKSTLAGKNTGTTNCIDLESGNFWVDGKRDDNWYIPYCQIANHLSEQGYTVFVSSHEVVRNELMKSDQSVYIIFPALNLKREWVCKLEQRYHMSGLEKDYKALMNAKTRYDDNIQELIDCADNDKNKIHGYAIGEMDYNLKEIINYLIERGSNI